MIKLPFTARVVGLSVAVSFATTYVVMMCGSAAPGAHEVSWGAWRDASNQDFCSGLQLSVTADRLGQERPELAIQLHAIASVVPPVQAFASSREALRTREQVLQQTKLMRDSVSLRQSAVSKLDAYLSPGSLAALQKERSDLCSRFYEAEQFAYARALVEHGLQEK